MQIHVHHALLTLFTKSMVVPKYRTVSVVQDTPGPLNMETTAQVRYPILLLVFVISFHIPDARESVVNCFEQGSKQPSHS